MSQGKVAETPDAFDADLHRDSRAGQHAGAATHETRSAFDVKELQEKLPDVSKADLKAIPLIQAGERLQQGAVYCNLNDLSAGPFTAMGGQEVGPDDYYVAKSELDYELWNRLTGGGGATENDDQGTAA
jgi:hypothetical protein